MKVDFPHPEGPMRAVTWRWATSRAMSFNTWVLPNQAFTPSAWILAGWAMAWLSADLSAGIGTGSIRTSSRVAAFRKAVGDGSSIVVMVHLPWPGFRVMTRASRFKASTSSTSTRAAAQA